MTIEMLNGRPRRKQLSDQLDRFDGIIDALANGLPEAVAAATREGAKQAAASAHRHDEARAKFVRCFAHKPSVDAINRWLIHRLDDIGQVRSKLILANDTGRMLGPAKFS